MHDDIFEEDDSDEDDKERCISYLDELLLLEGNEFITRLEEIKNLRDRDSVTEELVERIEELEYFSPPFDVIKALREVTYVETHGTGRKYYSKVFNALLFTSLAINDPFKNYIVNNLKEGEIYPKAEVVRILNTALSNIRLEFNSINNIESETIKFLNSIMEIKRIMPRDPSERIEIKLHNKYKIEVNPDLDFGKIKQHFLEPTTRYTGVEGEKTWKSFKFENI